MHRKKNSTDRLIRFYTIGFICVVLMTGCDKKQDTQIPPPVTDRSRIGYIIQDNFSVSVCSQVIDFAGLSTSLTDTGKHTFLAPINASFQRIGIARAPSFGYADGWFHNAIQYATLNGEHRFGQLPLAENQPIPSANGFNAYVSRYLVNEDTITTVNGVTISVGDVKASNGYLQIVTQVVQPETAKSIGEFLLNDTTFTLFTLALQHSGLLPVLQSDEKAFTLLAPPNIVMRQQGAISETIDLTSPDGILASDPAELANILAYHIIDGRYFLDWLQHTAAASDDHLVATLNGETVFVEGQAGGYNSATFTGKQNSIPINIFSYYSFPTYNIANIPAGNGVIHGIDGILLP